MEDSSLRSSLWMGDLESWMDENYLRQLWFSLGHQVSVKVVRSKTTGVPAGYCFLDFATPQAAQYAMEHFNGQIIPSTNSYFRLNWSSGGYTTGMRFDSGPEFSLFVGNLGREVNDFLLFTAFYPRYANCKSAKVVTDPQTGNSKGFGFVRFGDEIECHRALFEMNGQYCGMNPMRLDLAAPRTRAGTSTTGANAIGYSQAQYQQQQMMQQQQAHASSQFDPNYDPSSDPFNTKVFVGGLASHVTEDELRAHFAPYGDIVYVKIPSGKGCGFVHFAHRIMAEAAINSLNGTLLGGYPIRLTWARSAGSDKQRPIFNPSASHQVAPLDTFGTSSSSATSTLFSSTFGSSSSSLTAVSPLLATLPLLSPTLTDKPLSKDPLSSWDVKEENMSFLRKKQEAFDRFSDSLWKFTSNAPILRSSDRLPPPLLS